MKVEKRDRSFLLEAKEYEYPSNWNLKGQGFNFDTDWLIVSLEGKDGTEVFHMEGAYVRLGELVALYENLIRVENGFLKEMTSGFVEPNLQIKAVRKPESVDFMVKLEGEEDSWVLEEEYSLEEFRKIIESLFLEIEKCSQFQ